MNATHTHRGKDAMRTMMLLLSLSTFAVVPFAGAAERPADTPARTEAATVAYATTTFVQMALQTCAGQNPGIAEPAQEAWTGWVQRNKATADAAGAWLAYVVEIRGAGDPNRTTAVGAEIEAMATRTREALGRDAFAGQGQTPASCMGLAFQVNNGRFDLLGDPQTAAVLRELAAVNWTSP